MMAYEDGGASLGMQGGVFQHDVTAGHMVQGGWEQEEACVVFQAPPHCLCFCSHLPYSNQMQYPLVSSVVCMGGFHSYVLDLSQAK